MLFFTTRSSEILQRAVRAAVAAHRPSALRALLASHGDRAFARSLCCLSGRVIADALTMLPAPDRIRVQESLPCAALKRLRDLDSDNAHSLHSLFGHLTAIRADKAGDSGIVLSRRR